MKQRKKKLPACKNCNGKGHVGRCNNCNGTGRVTLTRRIAGTPKTTQGEELCGFCRGYGDFTCSSCGGTGKQVGQEAAERLMQIDDQL